MCRLFCALVVLFMALALPGCGQNAKTPAPPSEKPKVEGELAVTTLTPEAYKSLGIASEPIHTDKIQEFVELTGWIMAPQGKEVTITAPVAGYVRLPDKLKRSPMRGETVKAGQELFALEPVLSPVEEIQLKILKQGVESELKKAEDIFKNAQTELKRTQGLKAEGVKTQQDLEQAQLRFSHAEEDLKAAKKKQEFFENPIRTILARQPGTVLLVHASPGQYVAAAAPLVTIADLKTLWVRVAVPEFDLPAVEPKQPVTVRLKGVPGNGSPDGDNKQDWMRPMSAKPVALVPQVDALRHTADLIYELESAGTLRTHLAKDQMVTVFVPLGQKQLESVVPYSAVVFDTFGGSWIYVEKGEEKGRHQFERRRVDLGATVTSKVKGKVQERVVIRPTAASGERVVTAGAGVLFSREFHKTPVRP